MVDDIRTPQPHRRDYTRGIIASERTHHARPDSENSQRVGYVTAQGKESVGKPQRKKYIKPVIVVLLIAAGLVGAGLYFINHKHTSIPFPKTIGSILSYPTYYPSGDVNGYTYKNGSANIQADILFYSLTNGSKKIFITEQTVPNGRPNLSSLPKHTPLNVPIGQAIIGTGLGNPSIVIMTDTTLIQLTSSKGVSKADIIAVAQKLSVQN